MNLLSIENLSAGYGISQVLFGIDLHIARGEIVSLLGRNGMGKTTTVKSIMGILPTLSGTMRVEGKDMTLAPSFQIARAGLGLIPEGRQIFSNLTVHENLVATAGNRHHLPQPWDTDTVYRLFPRLLERKSSYGSNLSGGEQQMLAIGRALLTNPKLLILDEATEGLAPMIQVEIWRAIQLLKNRQQSILLIDKNLEPLLRLADRHYILEKGRIVWRGNSAVLRNDESLQHRYLGI